MGECNMLLIAQKQFELWGGKDSNICLNIGRFESPIEVLREFAPSTIMVMDRCESPYECVEGVPYSFNSWARFLHLLWSAGYDVASGSYKRFYGWRVAIVNPRENRGMWDRFDPPPQMCEHYIDDIDRVVWRDVQPECAEWNWQAVTV